MARRSRSSIPASSNCVSVGGRFRREHDGTAIEAMGLSLPFSSSMPAEDPANIQECVQVDADEMANRREAWEMPAYKATSGTL